MSKKNVQYMILALILVAIGAIYFFFIRKPSAPISPILTVGITPSQGQTILPHGSTLDTKALNDTRLQDMNPPIYPTVSKSELGVDNPFAPGQ